MNKLKLFLENFLIYGVGGIVSKIIPVVMIPIVTRLMPNTEYYGISDMANTIISFASAFAIMGMYDAMYRMFFEKDDKDYKKRVCSTTLIFTTITSVVVCLVMVIFKDVIANIFFRNKDLAYLVYITAIATLVGANNSIISAPTRMENRRKIFLITNTISPILAYMVSIPLLLKGYYIIALPIATVVSGVTLELLFAGLNHKWFDLSKFDVDILKKLLLIGVPLLPNFLIYWVFNSCDKLMITNILGVGETGIYSVGSKLGLVSQLIYTAFAGGWQFFAFSTMKESDQVKNNSYIFECLGIISFVCSLFVFVFCKPLYEFLFEADYIKGYLISPYLFFAPLLQMLYQIAANQFLIVKKTWPNMFILSIGAVINIFLNQLLIPIIGIEGAAIATLVGYLISDIICVIVLCRMELMIMSKRFMFAFGMTVTFTLMWRTFFAEDVIKTLFMAVGVAIIYGYMYKDEIIFIRNKCRKLIKDYL